MKIVGYVRVSSEEQVKNFSLANQEEYIRKRATEQNYELAKIFRDEGESAKTTERPGLLTMLEFCRQKKNGIVAILIYKIDRLSRSTTDYLGLRQHLSKYGIKIVSCTEPTSDTPEGEFIETILAAAGRYDNVIKGLRTKDGMRKCLESGRPPHLPAFGYKNAQDPEEKRIVVKDPEKFDKIKKLWQMMLKGIYTLSHISQAAEKMGLKGRRGGKLDTQFFSRLFRNKFYMGVISSAAFGKEYSGDFEPMVSPHEFAKIQMILDGRAHTTGIMQQRVNPDFPLRKFVLCAKCAHSFTGAWSKGRNRKYAYYWCPNHPQSFSKEQLETDFIQLLKTVTPTPQYVDLFIEIFKEVWGGHQQDLKKQVKQIKDGVRTIEERKAALVDKNLTGLYSDELFKQQIARLEEEILVKKALLSESEMKQVDIETLSNFAKFFMTDLARVWQTADLNGKVKLQKAIFPEGLVYSKEGFLNPSLALPFNLIPVSLGAKNEMG